MGHVPQSDFYFPARKSLYLTKSGRPSNQGKPSNQNRLLHVDKHGINYDFASVTIPSELICSCRSHIAEDIQNELK
jgi:hypothetical protein